MVDKKREILEIDTPWNVVGSKCDLVFNIGQT